jgi:high-affinity iron transporter
LLPAFLIGLREGLEASLVIGILVALLVKWERAELLPRLWLGVALAVALSLGIGFVLTFGTYTLSEEAEEVLAGALSILAVAMVTWMIFWMQRHGRELRGHLESDLGRAVATGGLWGVIAIAFVSVAREGVETALFLWSLVRSSGAAPEALIGAALGLGVAVLLGWALYRGLVRVNLRVFFTWTGLILILVAAGVLAYGVHELQEAAVLPGPETAAAPIDPATGEVAVGLGAWPWGWAFQIEDTIPPDGPLAAILRGTLGLRPVMSWLEVTAWALYVAVVGAVFVRRSLVPPSPRAAGQTALIPPAT